MSRISAKLLEPVVVNQLGSKKYHSDTIYAAQKMANLHNGLFSMLRSAYYEANRCSAAIDEQATSNAKSIYNGTFLIVMQLCEQLDVHHSIEENYVFPQLNRYAGKPIMASEVEQHKQIHSALNKLLSFATTQHYATDMPNKENLIKLIRLLDDMAEPLSQHMRDEIDTILTLQDYMAPHLVRQCLLG